MGNYEDAGFDAFLSRSVDTTPQPTLDAPGPVTTHIPFDRGAVSGIFPDTIRIGSAIRLDGPAKNIVLSDGTVDRLLLGFQKDGF